MNNKKVLCKALETVEEMLEDRGYIPIAKKFVHLDIIAKMKNREYIKPSNKRAIVIIADLISEIKSYSKFTHIYDTIFFVYTNNTTVVHKTIEKNLDYKIEIWSMFKLLINPAKHFLQPKIEKVDDPSLNNKKFQRIQFYDPIVRYYNFFHRDILKITENENGVTSITYRIVT